VGRNRADDALARAAAVTGANVVVGDDIEVLQGIGAILRRWFAGRSDAPVAHRHHGRVTCHGWQAEAVLRQATEALFPW
jgi:hypothetical protein